MDTAHRRRQNRASGLGRSYWSGGLLDLCSWGSGPCARAEAEEALNRVFRPEDESVCVWINKRAPAVLQISFDVEADDYAAAIQHGLFELRGAASPAGLPGRVIEMVAVTEEGQARRAE